jgi:putative flippase GtrA
MHIVSLIISFFLGALFGFVLHILLTFASIQSQREDFLENKHSNHYEQ